MRQSFIANLVCSNCGSGLELDKVWQKEKDDIQTGILKCECNRYPILEGILNLRKVGRKNYVFELMNKGKFLEAMAEQLEIKPYGKSSADIVFEKIARRYFKHLWVRYSKIKNRSILDQDNNSTFFTTIDGLKWGSWGDYLKHRFSSQTFFSALALVPLIEFTEGPILDIGCGAGHVSFVISEYFPEREIFCTDNFLIFLLLAKRFMVKKGQFICTDADAILPFKERYFRTILGCDFFHYVTSKYLHAQELKRILAEDGLILFPHLHIFPGPDIAPGIPLSLSAYDNLFHDLPRRFLPEEDLVKNFLFENRLDLTEKNTFKDSVKGENVSFIGSQNDKIFKVHTDIGKFFLNTKKNLVFNPIYKKIKENNNIELNISYPSNSFKKEYPLTCDILPQKYTITNGIIDDMGHIDKAILNSSHISELIRNFILINLPENYI